MAIALTGNPREDLELLRSWLAAPAPDQLAVSTSGSTGTPKRVMLSRDAVLASATASLARLGGAGQWLSALPTTGIGGAQVLVRSLVAGIEPVFADGDVLAALEQMTGERRYASFVPTQLFRLLEAGHGPALAHLDAILLGGAAAPSSLLDQGLNIVRTYGMSETAGGCVYDGLPLDDVQIRIGEGGVIEIAGPVLFDGYDGAPRTGRWWRTSDLGSIDDGVLSVWGRADDVAISGGVNVPLGAVERVLRDLPGVLDVAVVGRPDPEWGEVVTAFVVGELDLPAARDAVEAAGHPRAWAPREVRTLAALPVGATGKTDKQALRG